MKNIVKVWRSSVAFLLSAFSFLILITSCSNDIDEALHPAGNGAIQFVVSDFPAFGESGLTRAIGTQDEGKTAWEKDDQIIVTLTSQKYGEQAAALTYNGSSWKPRCPSADEWIRKLRYIYTMEYYSAIKKNTSESVLMRWMKLEPIIQNEVSLKENHQYSTNAYIWDSERW